MYMAVFNPMTVFTAFRIFSLFKKRNLIYMKKVKFHREILECNYKNFQKYHFSAYYDKSFISLSVSKWF